MHAFSEVGDRRRECTPCLIFHVCGMISGNVWMNLLLWSMKPLGEPCLIWKQRRHVGFLLLKALYLSEEWRRGAVGMQMRASLLSNTRPEIFSERTVPTRGKTLLDFVLDALVFPPGGHLLPGL